MRNPSNRTNRLPCLWSFSSLVSPPDCHAMTLRLIVSLWQPTIVCVYLKLISYPCFLIALCIRLGTDITDCRDILNGLFRRLINLLIQPRFLFLVFPVFSLLRATFLFGLHLYFLFLLWLLISYYCRCISRYVSN